MANAMNQLSVKPSVDPPAIAKRPPTCLQQRLAEFDVAEAEAAKWPNRLKKAIVQGLSGTGAIFVVLLAIMFPPLFPRDWQGLLLAVGASMVLTAFGFVTYAVLSWVDDVIERHWFWHTCSVVLLIATYGALLYVIFVSADFWLPHFRE